MRQSAHSTMFSTLSTIQKKRPFFDGRVIAGAKTRNGLDMLHLQAGEELGNLE